MLKNDNIYTLPSSIIKTANKIKDEFVANFARHDISFAVKQINLPTDEIEKGIICHYLYNHLDLDEEIVDSNEFSEIKKLALNFEKNVKYFDLIFDESCWDTHNKRWNLHEELLTDGHYHCGYYQSEDEFELTLIEIQNSFYFIDEVYEFDITYRDFIINPYDKSINKVRLFTDESDCIGLVKEVCSKTTGISIETANKLWY